MGYTNRRIRNRREAITTIMLMVPIAVVIPSEKYPKNKIAVLEPR